MEYDVQEWPARIQAPLQKSRAYVPSRPRWKDGRRCWVGLKPEDVVEVGIRIGRGDPLLVDRTAYIMDLMEPAVENCEQRAKPWTKEWGKLTSWEDDGKRKYAIVM